MGFLSKRVGGNITPHYGNLFRSMGIDTDNIESSSELSEHVYFTCLKHLAETMSKMPWEKRITTESKGKEKLYDANLDKLLNLRPNPLYTASTFWATIELNRLHYGNGYAYTEYKDGQAKSLWVLPSNEVTVWRDTEGFIDGKLWYIWTNPLNGKSYKMSQDEVLHVKTSITFDGIVGLSVREILITQLQTSMYAEGFLKKLYQNNMFGGKVMLSHQGDLRGEAKARVIKELTSFSTQEAGKFIPVPLGITPTLLDIKLSDAQFFENNKYNALAIAAAFGIKPNIINNYEKSSYSNSETQQLDFYVNTLQPLFRSYSQEVSYKMLPEFAIDRGERLDINAKILFKMDSKTQAEVYSKYLNNYAMTPNEVREEIDMPNHKLGDMLIGNGNYKPIEQVGNEEGKKYE